MTGDGVNDTLGAEGRRSGHRHGLRHGGCEVGRRPGPARRPVRHIARRRRRGPAGDRKHRTGRPSVRHQDRVGRRHRSAHRRVHDGVPDPAAAAHRRRRPHHRHPGVRPQLRAQSRTGSDRLYPARHAVLASRRRRGRAGHVGRVRAVPFRPRRRVRGSRRRAGPRSFSRRSACGRCTSWPGPSTPSELGSSPHWSRAGWRHSRSRSSPTSSCSRFRPSRWPWRSPPAWRLGRSRSAWGCATSTGRGADGSTRHRSRSPSTPCAIRGATCTRIVSRLLLAGPMPDAIGW